MGAFIPPVVAKDPHHPHLIKTWTIGLLYGDKKAQIDGTLSWRHTGHLGAYLTYGGVGAAVVVTVGVMLIARRRRGQIAP
jgi:hypothetical protein